MDHFTRKDLEFLTTGGSPPCVSIFQPAHRAGAPVRQDPIRLKNLLGHATEKLLATGRRRAEVDGILSPARALLDDEFFWRAQSDGLAVFVAAGGVFRRYRVPLHFEELVVVGQRFHVKPLVPLLTDDGRFYVLALSHDQVRLLDATREHAAEIPLCEVPKSITEAIGGDWEQKTLHAGRIAGNVRNVHGFGESGDLKDETAKFLQLVDAGILVELDDLKPPMVLAGVEYLVSMYRHGTKYPNAVEGFIEGNPELLDGDELRRRAWPLVEPIFRRARAEAMERFHTLAPRGRASGELEPIVAGAHDGRVMELFVALGAERWGRFEPATQTVELHDTPAPDDEDLLDEAARETLLHDGAVYALSPKEVPGGGLAAAVFRW